MAKSKDEVRAEALGVLRNRLRGGAAISMGVGKTRLGLDHFQLVVDKLQKTESRMAKALVAAPTKKIIKGWKDEAKKWGVEHLLDGIDFTTYRSLLKQGSDYDVIYLDECHSLKESYDEWLKGHQGWIVGLTGTPPKYQNSERGRMVAKYCPIVYSYMTKNAVEDKILNDYHITVHLLELETAKTHKVEVKDKSTGQVTNSWFTSEQADYDYWTERVDLTRGTKNQNWMSIRRMNAMKSYGSKADYGKRLLEKSKERCILFANTQKQADELCRHSYHANNKDSEENMAMFENGKIDKLSCVFQLSEGANIKGLKEVIMLHAYGNNRQASQRLGRALRLNPDEKAHIHILCYKNTVDEKWVEGALADYDDKKITWYDPDDF